MMQRRSFFQRVFGGIFAAAVAPLVPPAPQAPFKLHRKTVIGKIAGTAFNERPLENVCRREVHRSVTIAYSGEMHDGCYFYECLGPAAPDQSFIACTFDHCDGPIFVLS